MKSGFSKSRRGYTLIELSVAIACGLAAAALLMALVNQQFTFLRIYVAQNFLIREAPLINAHMNRLIGQAEWFRLHNSITDAPSGANPVTAGNASVLILNYQQPNGTRQAAMLAFQNGALNYYLVPVAGAPTLQWAVTREASNVSFSVVNGLLAVTLTGPNGEVITYYGTTQQ